MTDETKAPVRGGKRFGFLAMTLTLVLGIAIGGAIIAGLAMQRHHAMGLGHGPGWRVHQWMQDGPRGEEYALRRIERMVGFAARRLDATDDQKKRLADIASAAVRDLLPMRGKMRDARKQARQILTAPTIDRAALEALRAAQLAEADAASRRMTQAIADAAEVLTPEQRARLAKRFDF